MGWDGSNRRQFPRIIYPCMVKVKSAALPDQALLTHTENIGVGGLCVIVRQEVKVSTIVAVEIDLFDESDHIVSSGKVAWMVRRQETVLHKPLFYDLGIEFEFLKEKDKARLELAIALCIKKGFKVLKPVY